MWCTHTCAWGTDEDGSELLRWRLLWRGLCLELLDFVRELAHEGLEIGELVRGRSHFVKDGGVWWVEGGELGACEQTRETRNQKVRGSESVKCALNGFPYVRSDPAGASRVTYYASIAIVM